METQLRIQHSSNLPLAHLAPLAFSGDAERPKKGARDRAGGRRVGVGCDGRLRERYDECEVGQDREVCCDGEVGGDNEVGREAKLRSVDQVGCVRGVQKVGSAVTNGGGAFFWVGRCGGTF